MAQQVDKSILIGELIQIDEGIAEILMGAGLHCLGCPSSRVESIEEAAMVHGLDADLLTDRINEYLLLK